MRSDIRKVVVPHGIVDGLGPPQQEAMSVIDRALNRAGDAHVHTSSEDKAGEEGRRLMLKVLMHLSGGQGAHRPVAVSELHGLLSSAHTDQQITRTLEILESESIIQREDGSVLLNGGFLAGLVESKIGTEMASQRKVESFIASRYQYYQDAERIREGSGQLLSEMDLNYIGPFLHDVVLPAEQKAFIEKSEAAVRKGKRQRFRVIVAVMALLVLLAAVALFSAFHATDRAEEATEKGRDALEQRKVADRKAEEARLARLESEEQKGLAERARNEALDQKDHAERAQAIAMEERSRAQEATQEALRQKGIAEKANANLQDANAEISSLLESVTEEKNTAIHAEEAAMKAKSLSDDLRNILLSRTVAQRSLAMKESDKVLKAYTARLAYEINRESDQGNASHPDVFRAVYYAAKNQNGIVPPETDLAGGAIGTIRQLQGNGMIAAASDGNVFQFQINPSNGSIGARQQIFRLQHDAVRFAFPSKPGHAVVMGTFNSILEIEFVNDTDAQAVVKRKIELPPHVFVKNAQELANEEFLIQTTDGALHSLDSNRDQLQLVLDADHRAIAFAALPALGLLCYADPGNHLVLTDLKGENAVRYTDAKKKVAQMRLKQYANTIYLALGYTDGEIEVFTSPKDVFLNAYSSKLQGKGLYSIESLRSGVHSGYIPYMVFAENVPRLAVCSYDGTASVWDLDAWTADRSAYLPIILDDHGDWVTTCAFVNQDEALLTGTKLGTAKFWHLDPEAYASRLCSRISRLPTDEEWSEYIGDELSEFKDKVCK